MYGWDVVWQWKYAWGDTAAKRLRMRQFGHFRSRSNLVPRARARLGQRRPRVHGLWDNQQPEARFLASGLKADTADPREGSLGIYRKGQKKRQPHWGFLENKTTQTNAVNDLGLFAT